ncbi:MAG: type VI secretion system baseplate subunit TssE [Frateuria sp.]|uniref:type VI secretion system baseplate subunit TssE n=1 Tax=Frateuria sp. TaxID=2211372 RepID=UPI00182B012E|nr:type VI secretion system baseplate subunit TssE [Frateuria sp.]NUO71546.1 type VI secretion system baseplate subunit TssE [Frateuria sp.]NUR21984.1 type VI secretion system baseplate subunit TssE [Frateuria sp.]
MAELTTQERLQPSLLDRLTDEEPGKQEESREKRVISATRLRDCVARDISWLLNCVSLGSGVELDDYPEVARSVLNFGIPDLTGMALAGVDASVLQRQLREALLAFEPRLTGSTLRVAVNTNTKRMDQQSLVFNIESEMWAQPIPLNLYLKTEVDLETGRFSVSESLG